MKKYHLTKDGNQWKLREEGSQRASEVYKTKSAGLESAPGFVRSQGGGSLKIHKENGRIQEERTYPKSADPKKTKG